MERKVGQTTAKRLSPSSDNPNRRSFQFLVNSKGLITRKHNYFEIGFADCEMMVSPAALTY